MPKVAQIKKKGGASFKLGNVAHKDCSNYVNIHNKKYWISFILPQYHVFTKPMFFVFLVSLSIISKIHRPFPNLELIQLLFVLPREEAK